MKVCTKHRDAEIRYGTRYGECPLCAQITAIGEAAQDLSCAMDDVREFTETIVLPQLVRDALGRVSRLLDETFDGAVGDLK